MSKDLPESLSFKEDLNLYRYCNGNLNFSTVSHDDEDYSYQKKKMMRDPMSHRIIEKRRRDRMNNCLADLSRLIPPDYLKKGRGRIEKTEIIEMAIKHMRHLQSIISSSRLSETQCDNPVRVPQESNGSRDGEILSTPGQQPIVMEHYRLGYLECLSEAMHFLVEVQGYFAGDSLCVQMINHLHRHCDKILKSNSLNYPRKHTGETTSSNPSTSPSSGNYSNNSPPLGTSISNGSNSDDNQPNVPFASDRTFEPIEHPGKTMHGDFRSPARYSELSASSQSRDPKKNCESCYTRYSEHDNERMSENPSDSDLEQGHTSNCTARDSRMFLNGCEDQSKCIRMNCMPGNCSTSSGIGSNPECPLTDDELLVKEENGSSHLRDMLTAPKIIPNGMNPARASEPKRSGSPMPQVFGTDPPSVRPPHGPQSAYLGEHVRFHSDSVHCKIQSPADEGHQESHNPTAADTCYAEVSNSDGHGNMYKFKNNIKQRFSKERRINDEDGPRKRQKSNEETPNGEGYHHCDNQGKYQELSHKEIQPYTRRNDDCDGRRRIRYPSESEMHISQEIDAITLPNRLSFGHRADHRLKTTEDNDKLSRMKYSAPFYSSDIPLECKALDSRPKPIGLLTITEYLPPETGLARKLATPEPDRKVGVPIFALHANGSFYVPLTLDQRLLAPFLSLLGMTKSEEADPKAVLHPVTISVNFQPPFLSKNTEATPWKSQSFP